MIDYAGPHTRLMKARPPGALREWILSTLIWALVVGVFVAAVISGVIFKTAPLLLFLLPLGVIFLLMMGTRTIRQVRRRRAQAVMTYVEQAVRLNLPLPAMLAAAEQGERPAVVRQLAALRSLLQDGQPLAMALATATPQLPPRDLALVQAGERTGQLAPTLRRLMHEQRDRLPRDLATGAFYRVYPVIMLLMLSGVVSLLMIVVVPRFQGILRDFGIPMPAITQWMIDIASDWSVPVFIFVGMILLIMMARTLAETFVPPRYRLKLLPGMIDRLIWSLPLFHSAARDQGLADVCQVLSDAVAAGMPLDGALGESSQLDINEVLRQRIEAWAAGVHQGLATETAARDAGLPRLLVGMLATGRAASDLPSVFGFLARYYQSRFSRLKLLLEGAIVPVVVFIMAGLVLAVALSLFLPMITLLDRTAVLTRLW